MLKKKQRVSKTILSSNAPIGYNDILDSVIQKIQLARGRAMSAVNKELNSQA